MKVEEIQARLRELNSQKFLNDDEVDEKEELLNTLAMIRGEQRKQDQKDKKPTESNNNTVKREHTVVGKAIAKGVKAVVEHFKEKPVTYEELQALKMKAMKERLKADITKSKKVQRDSKGDIFGSSNSRPRKSARSQRGDSMDDVSKLLRGSIKSDKDFTFFSNKSDRDVRKTLGI